MKNFKILACLTKSNDLHHKQNLHLIASTMLVDEDINFNGFFRFIENDRRGKKTIVVYVSNNSLDISVNKDYLKPSESSRVARGKVKNELTDYTE